MNSKPECVDYFEQVLDGRIVACRRLKQLAAMMLDRIENGYKDWHFDYDYACRPIRFVTQFCKLPSGKMGSPFNMELFQKAMIQVMFGFVDDSGNRQFHEVLWLEARKQGKTSLAAALELYMLMADGEGAPQVYNCATSRAQAVRSSSVPASLSSLSSMLSSSLPSADENSDTFSSRSPNFSQSPLRSQYGLISLARM